jgi:hypothetical protein
MKAPRTAQPGDAWFRDLAAAMARIEARQAAYEAVARRVLDTLEVHTEKLDAIIEAATREPGPSPVAEILTAILSSLREQEGLLLDLPQALTEAMRGELWLDPAEKDAEEPEMMEPAGSWRYPARPGGGS